MVGQDEENRPPGFSDHLAENDAVKLAGLALAVGLDPLLVLDCHDPVRMAALEVVVDVAARHAGEAREDLATRLGNVMAKVLS